MLEGLIYCRLGSCIPSSSLCPSSFRATELSSSGLQLVSCLVARVLTSRPRWNFCHPSIRRTAVGQLQGQPSPCSCPPASESKRGAREESRIPDASFVGCLCPRRAWARPIDSAKLLPSRSDNNRSQDANRQRGSLRFARHLRRVKEKDHDRPTQDLLSDGPDGSSGRLLRQSMRCPCIE